MFAYETWQKCRDQITAEHRLPVAKEQLEQQWKSWIAKDEFKACMEAATLLLNGHWISRPSDTIPGCGAQRNRFRFLSNTEKIRTIQSNSEQFS